MPFRSAFLTGLALALPFGPVLSGQTPDSVPSESLALGTDLPVVEETLDNGMRILVLPREGTATVSFVVRYGVGSLHERVGETGIAHVLEHMLFKGTTTVGTRDLEAERALFGEMDALQERILRQKGRPVPDSTLLDVLSDSLEALEDSARTFVESNEFDRILSEHGARNLNATTGLEGTTYFVQLPANRARLWFVLEADRMANPVFREFYTERDVVTEERRSRIDDDPSGRLYEEHLGLAYRAHPYGVPVIGHMSDLENLTRAQAREYYERFYGARNAVVTVVGAIRPDSILRWADDYLGRIRPGRRPDPVLTREPEQRGERRAEVVFDAEPRVRMGWHVVARHHPDTPALLVMSSLLTGGRTSRLQRRMIREERLATFVGSSVGPGDLHPALFSIEAVPRAPHTTEELERAIYEEIDRLKRQPPGDDELQRVRNQLEASRIRRLESNLGLALQLATAESKFRDWRETFRFTERLRDVEPEDVRKVARRYFSAENRSVATLVPEDDEREGVEQEDARETGASGGTP